MEPCAVLPLTKTWYGFAERAEPTDGPEGWLSCNGLYSMTTIKHIGWFMRERGMTYQLAKQLYQDNKEYNINTGEVRDRV